MITGEQLLEMQMRVEAGKRVKTRQDSITDVSEPFEGLESELHEKIAADLRRRRWYFVRSRMDKRSTNQLGAPDFIVAAPPKTITAPTIPPHPKISTDYPTTYWLEIKRKGSKLSKEQTITKHVLLALGHNYACLYSFDDYLRAIGDL